MLPRVLIPALDCRAWWRIVRSWRWRIVVVLVADPLGNGSGPTEEAQGDEAEHQHPDEDDQPDHGGESKPARFGCVGHLAGEHLHRPGVRDTLTECPGDEDHDARHDGKCGCERQGRQHEGRPRPHGSGLGCVDASVGAPSVCANGERRCEVGQDHQCRQQGDHPPRAALGAGVGTHGEPDQHRTGADDIEEAMASIGIRAVTVRRPDLVVRRCTDDEGEQPCEERLGHQPHPRLSQIDQERLLTEPPQDTLLACEHEIPERARGHDDQERAPCADQQTEDDQDGEPDDGRPDETVPEWLENEGPGRQ